MNRNHQGAREMILKDWNIERSKVGAIREM